MKKLRKNWYLGFLGVFGFQGIFNLLAGDLYGSIWIIWFVWFVYFFEK